MELPKVLLLGAALLVSWTVTLSLISPTFVVHERGAILITGASSGIGLHASLSLVDRGYDVFMGVRKEKDGEALRAMRPGNQHVRPIIIDVTKSDQIAQARDTVLAFCREQDLPLVGLVNNAGVSVGGPMEYTEMSDLRWVFDVNYFGAVEVTKAFLPQLMEHKGRLVNIGSVAGIIATPYVSSYSATKFALNGMTEAMRRELRPFGVAVSIVEPAYVLTSINEKGEDRYLEYPAEAMAKYALAEAQEARDRHFRMASPPQVTTDAIVHSLTSPAPHAHYVVANVDGIPAFILAFLQAHLPSYVMDFIIVSAK